jgi:hypothetical protein
MLYLYITWPSKLIQHNLPYCLNNNWSFLSLNISGLLGLAVDQQGHAYISGLHSHDIHRLSPDGTFRDIVLSKHDGVDRPVGITFNNDFTKLFIINREGESVLVYRCKWKILYFVDEGFLYFVDEGMPLM